MSTTVDLEGDLQKVYVKANSEFHLDMLPGDLNYSTYNTKALAVKQLSLDEDINRGITLAAWNGHEFELVVARNPYTSSSPLRHIQKNGKRYIRFQTSITGIASIVENAEIYMVVYSPADSVIKPSDVRGAIKAYPNADNTGWLFKHTEQGTHHDISLSFEDAVCTVFKPYLDELNSEVMNLDPRDAPHGRKVAEYTAAVSVQGKVIAQVVKTDASRYLGYYQQNEHPEAGHVITAVKDALAQVKVDNRAVWNRASTTLGDIEKGVNARAARIVETRWGQEARLAAEAKAAKEAEE